LERIDQVMKPLKHWV